MDTTYVKELLEKVAEQDVSVEEAYEQLKNLPYEELGYANIDEHRALRTGQAEVIFGEGKTPEQIVGIAERMAENHARVLVTRTTQEVYEAVARVLPDAVWHETAGLITAEAEPDADDTESALREEGSGATDAKTAVHNDPAVEDGAWQASRIAIVTAGTADIPVAEEAALTAEFMGNIVDRIFDVGVAGIHRLLDQTEKIRRADAVIVIAGMEGALASVVGGLVEVPVIAVPTSVGYGASFDGLAALLSMLNSCANGVGVVNIDNGYGAACLAAKICAKQA